jgi:hypothetical protein
MSPKYRPLRLPVSPKYRVSLIAIVTVIILVAWCLTAGLWIHFEHNGHTWDIAADRFNTWGIYQDGMSIFDLPPARCELYQSPATLDFYEACPGDRPHILPECASGKIYRGLCIIN